MVNQEILEGLRNALARGYTLESAMMSFFNAGYKKKEIEEAAMQLHNHPSVQLSHPEKPSSPEEIHKQAVKPLPASHLEIPSKKTIQKKVSAYSERAEHVKINLKIIILIILLITLIGAFASVIIFKEEVINFFNNLLV